MHSRGAPATLPRNGAINICMAMNGNKMTAGYDFPPDLQIDVIQTATFDGGTAKGLWSARQQAGATEVAADTGTVARD